MWRANSVVYSLIQILCNTKPNIPHIPKSECFVEKHSKLDKLIFFILCFIFFKYTNYIYYLFTINV